MGGDDLVRRATRGDREAIEELFCQEWPAVYRLVASVIRDDAEARDVTQEVFVRAWNALDRYRPTGAPFRAYLQAIARNLLRERWRRRRLQLVPLDRATDVAAPDAVDELVLAALVEEDVERALESLPETYREVIRLRVLDGRPTSEVAALLGRSPGAVRVLLYRALSQLRDRVRERVEP